MRTKVLTICLALLAVCSMSGFANGQSESAKGKDSLPVIGATIYKYDDNYMSFVRKAIENDAPGKATLLIADSMNDQSKQNDQIDTYINKGVQALAVNLVDPAAGGTIVAKARKAGIPIIFFNKEPDKSVIMGYDKCWYAGITSAEFGIQQGQMIVDAWKKNPQWDKNGDGAIQYVLLKGEPGHPDAEVRTTEPIRIIKEAGIGADELELQTGMWDAAKGKDLMETWLAKHGDSIEFVICNNDAMALGAVEALKAAGYFTDGKYMPVVGVDGLPEAITLIEKGQMLGTVLNNPKALGDAAFEMARNVALGNDPCAGTDLVLGDRKDVRVNCEITMKGNLQNAIDAYK
ncbi:galactose ABC transporter substrate-binding protein [uncultured Sphaerochaeta sp.]|uniref:galactose ABC transporter substrate-binding protein n=1 Tax=uncultured Sphaerochaeta sp. TaxID=886478 RepID=UPI002A0A5C27|nr:galactose ABC transporter substrate-binding protein [uncultured Sphaerochaeta sp.]